MVNLFWTRQGILKLLINAQQLRYYLHTYCTYLGVHSVKFWQNVYTCETTVVKILRGSPILNISFCPLRIHSFLTTPPTPAKLLLICFLQLFMILWHFLEFNPAGYSIFWVGFSLSIMTLIFTQVVACINNLFLHYFWAGFHCINTTNFVYHSPINGYFGFPVWGSYKWSSCKYLCISLYVDTCGLSFLWGK